MSTVRNGSGPVVRTRLEPVALQWASLLNGYLEAWAGLPVWQLPWLESLPGPPALLLPPVAKPATGSQHSSAERS